MLVGRGDEVVVQHWFSVACIACTCASLLGESSWRLVDGENELPRPCQSRLLVLRYPGCVDVDMVLIVEGDGCYRNFRPYKDLLALGPCTETVD